MKKYLLPKDGNFYKANLHCHSVLSDGEKTPEEIKALYKEKGYSIVAYTDHDLFIPHNDLTDDTFLALNGFEVEVNEEYNGRDFNHVKTCHICFIALCDNNFIHPLWHREKYLFGNAPQYKDMVQFDETKPDYERNYDGETISDMMRVGRENGFFVTYNHPTWSLESYPEYMSYDGMHAFEMFNGGLSIGYEDYNPRVYDDLLRGGKRIYCIGADDNHNHKPDDSRYSGSGWAFTVIKADKLSYKSITDAMVNGSFYASEGPEIKELYYEDGKVYIKCSAADRILFNSEYRFAGIKLDETGEGICEASFDVNPDCGYFRLTVIDKNGKHACTNAYFVDELTD